MRHPRLAAVVWIACLAPVPPAAAEPREAPAARPPGDPARASNGVVVAGSGEARDRSGAAWHAVAPGALLPVGAELRAVTEALRVELRGGATIEVAPDSSAALYGESELVFADYGKLTVAHVEPRRGELSVVAAAPNGGRSAERGCVLVRGPGDVMAVVRTGSGRARALPARGDLPGGLVVAMYEGDARVSAGGGVKPVHGGELVELRSGRRMPSPRLLGPGPAWIQDDGPSRVGALAIVGSPEAVAPLTLQIGPVDGAIGYDAEIARDESFADIVARRSLSPTDTTLVTPPLGVGRYFARVRARGSEGLPGYAGPTRALRVALASLTKGSAVDGASVVLPRAGSLTWDDPGGLEVSVGRIGFVWAPAQLGLGRDLEPVAVRVRLAGERSFVPLTLIPRSLRAEVEIGPKRARWPADPLEISVRLVDPKGSPPSFEPALRVTVNHAEVPVRWRRDAAFFRATLSPSMTPGPWVVGVEATDPDGNELGTGFLEVVGQASR